MRPFLRVLSFVLGLSLLVGCGAHGAALHAGQSYAYSPDVSVRLAFTRPSWSQLRLQVTIVPTGNTPLESLIPDIVVVPDGGRELSATLDLHSDQAVMTMLLENAEKVATVTIRDARNGHSARWDVGNVQARLGCKPGDDCGVLGVPRTPSLPLHP